MFEAIGTHEATRKPWMLAVSLAGQSVMIGLAILIPLVTTEALPHARFLELLSLPEPPPAMPKRAPDQVARQAKLVPARTTPTIFQAPARVPTGITKIIDPETLPAPALAAVGVPGGIGAAASGGNNVITGLAREMPRATPPAPARTPEPAKAIQRIRLGGQVQMAKLISGPAPVYPPLARQARISGVVLLEAVIARDGTIMDLHVVKGHPLLVPAAMAAVRNWRFQPSSLNGEPVEVTTEIEVNFKLGE